MHVFQEDMVDMSISTDVRTLKANLEQRLIGQAHIVDVVYTKTIVARAGLFDPSKPLGSYGRTFRRWENGNGQNSCKGRIRQTCEACTFRHDGFQGETQCRPV